MRSGWDASLPCECDDSRLLLNCLGTAPELAPPTEVLRAPYPEGRRQATAPKEFEPYRRAVLGACTGHASSGLSGRCGVR